MGVTDGQWHSLRRMLMARNPALVAEVERQAAEKRRIRALFGTDAANAGKNHEDGR